MTTLEDNEIRLEQDELKNESKRGAWYSSAVFNLIINIIAGLITAAILFFVDTTSKLLIVIAAFAILTLVISTILSFVKTKKLGNKLDEASKELTNYKINYEHRLHNMGIVEIVEAMGKGSWSPDALTERTNQNLCFLGVFGYKWVKDTQREKNFRAMLTRIQLNGGCVKFLLLNPNKISAKKLAYYRNQEPDIYKDFPSIEIYKNFAREFDCFEIRLFDHFPFLRLAISDGSCAISRFKTHMATEETLRAPQLVFTSEGPENNWSLYQAFVLLYNHLWKRAKDPFILEKIELNETDKEDEGDIIFKGENSND